MIAQVDYLAENPEWLEFQKYVETQLEPLIYVKSRELFTQAIAIAIGFEGGWRAAGGSTESSNEDWELDE